MNIGLPVAKVGKYCQKVRPQDVLALLDSGLNFAGIGLRLGISRERVRQIVLRNTGQSADDISLNKKFREFREFLHPFAVEAESRGMTVEGVPAESKYFAYRKHRYIINGKLCLMLSANKRHCGYYNIKRPEIECDFAVYRIPAPREGWLIVPEMALPRTATMFRLFGELAKSGAISKRHDWPSYYNAWHLLQEAEP